MLLAYVASAVVGVILLAASLLGGHDGDLGHHASVEHEGAVFALLSVRVWTYLLAFGGATGVLLHVVAGVHEPWAAVTSLGAGIAAAALARGLIARAARLGPSGTVKKADLVGRVAGVLVPFQSGSTGKVRLRVAESDVDLLATTDDPEPFASGAEVLILELRDDGAAVVTRAPK